MEIPQTTQKIQTILNSNAEKEAVSDFYSIDQSDFEENFGHNPALNYYDDFKILLEDFLSKKTMNLVWQDRYFCLTPKRLLYYSDATKQELKGCFNLVSLKQHGLRLQEQDFMLKFLVRVPAIEAEQNIQKQIIRLSFENQKDRIEIWKNYLTGIIEEKENTLGQLYSKITSEQILNPIQKINGLNYWNKIYITGEQFESYVNHLDIILFRSRKPVAYLHRILMRSHYDHVGLLFKNNFNRLFILEAIQSRGVWITPWEDILPHLQEVYEEISYRKLLLNSSDNINLELLEQYLNKLIGKKYELSLSKLLIAEEDEEERASKKMISKESQCMTLGKKKTQHGSLKQRTYFCSELIADIYIKFGLIKGKKRHEFWPRDFQNQLQLSDAYLSPLMDIRL